MVTRNRARSAVNNLLGTRDRFSSEDRRWSWGPDASPGEQLQIQMKLGLLSCGAHFLLRGPVGWRGWGVGEWRLGTLGLGDIKNQNANDLPFTNSCARVWSHSTKEAPFSIILQKMKLILFINSYTIGVTWARLLAYKVTLIGMWLSLRVIPWFGPSFPVAHVYLSNRS